MPDTPIIGAQLTVLDLPRHRDWLIEKNRDLELPEFCMADILARPDPFIDMARKALDGWEGRLGIHGPFAGFELDVKDKEIRAIAQARIDRALDVCEELGATQMVLHSPYDHWDTHNIDNKPTDRAGRVSAISETLAPAVQRAGEIGVEIVLENIKDTDPAHRAAVVEAVASPALKLSVDVGHAYWAHVTCGGPPVDRFISAAGETLTHLHLQDGDGYADRHWVLGAGTIPFAPIFSELERLGSNPRLIVEINDFSRVSDCAAHLEALGLAQ